MSKLPDTWQEVKLKDIATFSQGLQVGVEEQVSTPIDNYVRFIRIVDYTQKNEDIRFVENKGQRYFASKSDIVMVRYGTPGLVGRGIEGIIANNLFKINLDQKVANNDFFEHLLKSSFVQNKLQSGSASTTMPAINFSTLNTVVIPLPPLEEQKKIADILSTVDKKIAFVEENINTTEELKKGLMQKLLTEGIGHTEFKDSELGRIPESWEVVELKENVIEIRGGASFKPSDFTEKGHKVLHKGNVIHGGKLLQKETKYTSTKHFNNNLSNVVNNKYLITTLRDLVPSGPTIGLIVRINNNEEYILAQGAYGFIVNENLNEDFLIQYSNSKKYRKLMQSIAVGSTQIHIRNGDFLNIKIPFPPFEEQKEIAEILLTIDNKLENLKEKKQSFEELKKGLMQKLLTGEVRV